MKKNPKDGGRYQESVKAVKTATAKIARACEKQFKLPPGVVRISLTKLAPKTRDRLVAEFK
jgi:hypothetical protein